MLADHVEERSTGARNGHPIVTVGLIGPAHLRWGRRPVRFAKRRWLRPVATGLPVEFVAPRQGPNILVATQTRVLEAVVDQRDDLLPSTPIITIRAGRLWHVGAALTSPVLSTVAARRHEGRPGHAGRSS